MYSKYIVPFIAFCRQVYLHWRHSNFQLSSLSSNNKTDEKFRSKCLHYYCFLATLYLKVLERGNLWEFYWGKGGSPLVINGYQGKSKFTVFQVSRDDFFFLLKLLNLFPRCTSSLNNQATFQTWDTHLHL